MRKQVWIFSCYYLYTFVCIFCMEPPVAIHVSVHFARPSDQSVLRREDIQLVTTLSYQAILENYQVSVKYE